MIQSLEDEIRKEIEAEMTAGIKGAQGLKADIAGMGQAIRLEYPKEWKKLETSWNEEQFPGIRSELQVSVKLAATGRSFDSYKQASSNGQEGKQVKQVKQVKARQPTVSAGQIAMFILLFTIGSAPMLQLGIPAAQDSWLALSAAAAVGIGVLWMYRTLQNRAPESDLATSLQAAFRQAHRRGARRRAGTRIRL